MMFGEASSVGRQALATRDRLRLSQNPIRKIRLGLLTLPAIAEPVAIFFAPARQKTRSVAALHKRLITPLERKIDPARWVARVNGPLCVVRRSFDSTKFLSSRLDSPVHMLVQGAFRKC